LLGKTPYFGSLFSFGADVASGSDPVFTAKRLLAEALISLMIPGVPLLAELALVVV